MIDKIAHKLLLESDFIISLAETASHRYKKIIIKKKNKENRIIYAPAREIKSIQKIILDDVLVNLPLHRCAFAYRKNNSTKDAVIPHKDNKYFLKMDFKSFFYSIKRDDIYTYLNDCTRKNIISINEQNILFILDICCFHKALVIGAVTSPYLSNAICFELDNIIESKCNLLGVTYTRYSDDLFFSVKNKNILRDIPALLESILKELKYPKSLVINKKKTINTSKKHNVNILGLNITNSNTISIGRENKRKIKSQIYNWKKLDDKERQKIQGMLSYYRSIEPDFISRLCIKYGADMINQIISFTPHVEDQKEVNNL